MSEDTNSTYIHKDTPMPCKTKKFFADKDNEQPSNTYIGNLETGSQFYHTNSENGSKRLEPNGSFHKNNLAFEFGKNVYQNSINPSQGFNSSSLPSDLFGIIRKENSSLNSRNTPAQQEDGNKVDINDSRNYCNQRNLSQEDMVLKHTTMQKNVNPQFYNPSLVQNMVPSNFINNYSNGQIPYAVLQQMGSNMNLLPSTQVPNFNKFQPFKKGQMLANNYPSQTVGPVPVKSYPLDSPALAKNYYLELKKSSNDVDVSVADIFRLRYDSVPPSVSEIDKVVSFVRSSQNDNLTESRDKNNSIHVSDSSPNKTPNNEDQNQLLNSNEEVCSHSFLKKSDLVNSTKLPINFNDELFKTPNENQDIDKSKIESTTHKTGQLSPIMDKNQNEVKNNFDESKSSIYMHKLLDSIQTTAFNALSESKVLNKSTNLKKTYSSMSQSLKDTEISYHPNETFVPNNSNHNSTNIDNFGGFFDGISKELEKEEKIAALSHILSHSLLDFEIVMKLIVGLLVNLHNGYKCIIKPEASKELIISNMEKILLSNIPIMEQIPKEFVNKIFELASFLNQNIVTSNEPKKLSISETMSLQEICNFFYPPQDVLLRHMPMNYNINMNPQIKQNMNSYISGIPNIPSSTPQQPMQRVRNRKFTSGISSCNVYDGIQQKKRGRPRKIKDSNVIEPVNSKKNKSNHNESLNNSNNSNENMNSILDSINFTPQTIPLKAIINCNGISLPFESYKINPIENEIKVVAPIFLPVPDKIVNYTLETSNIIKEKEFEKTIEIEVIQEKEENKNAEEPTKITEKAKSDIKKKEISNKKHKNPVADENAVTDEKVNTRSGTFLKKINKPEMNKPKKAGKTKKEESKVPILRRSKRQKN